MPADVIFLLAGVIPLGLALGVLLREHGRQVGRLPGWSAWLLAQLVTLQNRWLGAERAIKTVRGLITGVLRGPVARQSTSTRAGDDKPEAVEVVLRLIRWLCAHGEMTQAGRSNLGVVGISCALTNWGAGWEAERLGLAAQSLLLDYPGCRQHWHPQGVSTDTNLRQLRALLAQSVAWPAQE